jgi:CheY-like chemotaxis protein
MVVEDDAANRTLFRFWLGTRGFRVVEAANGREAIETAKNEHPDLIMMDLGLPVLDGFATMRRIREIGELRQVPIIVVTSFSEVDCGADAAAAGCNEFIGKPVEFDRLEKLLRGLMQPNPPQQ